MRSRGGAVLSSARVDGIPRPWLDEIGDRVELIADPDGRALVMTEMAMAAHRRREVASDTLSEMLELVEAARFWAHNEREEGFAMGLLKFESEAEWE